MDTRARDSASNIPLTGVSCVLRWVVFSSEDSSSYSFARESSCFKSSLNDISPRHTPGFSSTLPYISFMLSPPVFLCPFHLRRRWMCHFSGCFPPSVGRLREVRDGRGICCSTGLHTTTQRSPQNGEEEVPEWKRESRLGEGDVTAELFKASPSSSSSFVSPPSLPRGNCTATAQGIEGEREGREGSSRCSKEFWYTGRITRPLLSLK